MEREPGQDPEHDGPSDPQSDPGSGPDSPGPDDAGSPGGSGSPGVSGSGSGSGSVAATPATPATVAAELTAHDALAAHAEAEYGITTVSRIAPLQDAIAVSIAFAAGAVLPWLAIVLIPGPSRALVTFAIVLAALAVTGWVAARIAQVHPLIPMVRTASVGGLAMLITYLGGHFLHPLAVPAGVPFCPRCR